MRPIHLTLSGLHSFREKQEVDFTALCEGGVFGIFGPTGSGKSSLLDAMTLALYGRVERATNQTQGIMNHAEEELTVSFTFELGSAEKVKRYRVERSFKRASDVSVRTATCRLLHIRSSTETIVLADKAGEVQQEILSLLGLTIDDFTRAVVLPQGKFAEFLSLKGVERRQMLQRLFHLERYGDHLNETLRQRVYATKSELEQVQAEQQGLGDASTEAVQKAEKALQDWDQEVQNWEVKKTEMDQAYEQKKTIWQTQHELQQVQETLHNLQQKEAEMNQFQQRLKQANEAQQLKHYIEHLEKTEQMKKEWQFKKIDCEKEVQRSQEQEEKSAQQAQRAKQQRDQEERPLIERQTKLRDGLELQQEVDQLKKKVQDTEQAIAQSRKQEMEWKNEYQQEQELLQKAKEKQAAIKEKLKSVSSSYEYKEKVRKAREAQKEIEHLSKQCIDQQKELASIQAQAQAHEQQRNTLQHEEKRMEQAGASLQQEWTEKLAASQKLTSKVASWLKNNQTHTEQQEQEVMKLKEKSLAAHLVDQLQEDQPCPVCGSMEHPNPADHDSVWNEQIKEMEQALNRKRAEQRQMERVSQELYQLQHRIEQYGQEINERLQLSPFSQKASQESAVSLANEEGAHESDGMGTVREEEVQRLQADTHTLERACTDWKKDWQQLMKKLDEMRLVNQNDKQQTEEKEQKIMRLQKEIDERKQAWSKSYPEFAYEQVQQLYEQLNQAEQKANEWQKKIDISISFIEEKEQAVQALDQKLRDLQLSLTQLKTQEQQYKGTLDRYIQKLEQLIEGKEQTIHQALQEVQHRLAELKQQEQITEQEWQKSQQQLRIAEQELAVATETLQDTSKRLEHLEQEWTTVCADSVFSTITAVKEALVSEEERKEWEQTLKRYTDEVQKWKQEEDRLIQLMQGQTISEQEWQEFLHARKQIQQSYDHALQEKGVRARELSLLQEKHTRYEELERNRKRLEALAEQLGKLQAVFRGNSFVEFVAEEQLMHVCRDASQRLASLTRQRYALELDSQGGFVIRDDANGGVRRPVSTLSGGETFLTSLALALALSAQIQLQGEYPLEFFFLDEGFGTLDPELLETVIDALENLHHQSLSVGVISHVPELRERLPRRLVVRPAEPSGKGSQVSIETL